jgi:YbbR domain-containing protein
MNLFHWFGRNFTSLLLSLLLALVIWTSAVTSSNPNIEAELTIPFIVEQQAADLAIVDPLPETVLITILAPESVHNQIKDDNPLIATIDLTDIEAGTYRFPVEVKNQELVSPIRILEQNPKSIQLEVSNLISKEFSVSVQVEGEPAIGYQTSGLEWENKTVNVMGQDNYVQNVNAVVGILDISDASGSITEDVPLEARNAAGEVIEEVSISPDVIQVNQTISLQGGYRNVAVNVTTQGIVEPGYRFTSITPAPPTVMVFSQDPQLVEALPGYVNTKPIDLTGVDSYLETILELDLPDGVTVVGDPTVLVQVNVTALETNMLISREIEVIGLLPGLRAEVSPPQVSVRVSGPVPVLDNLTLRDIRVVVDLTNLEVGVHTLEPTIEILPSEVVLEDVSPTTVEIVIMENPG